MKNHQTNRGIAPIIIVLIIVGILAAAGGGVYLWRKKTTPNVITLTPPTQQDETLGTNPEPTEELQTYRNEEYGFEVKYPAEFSLSDEASDRIWIGTPSSEEELRDMAIKRELLASSIFKSPSFSYFDQKINKEIKVQKSVRIDVIDFQWKQKVFVGLYNDIGKFEESDKLTSQNIPQGYYQWGPATAHYPTTWSCLYKAIYIPHKKNTLMISLRNCNVSQSSSPDEFLSPPNNSSFVVNELASQILSTFKFID